MCKALLLACSSYDADAIARKITDTSSHRRHIVIVTWRHSLQQSMSIKSRTVRTVKLFRVGLACCFLLRPHRDTRTAHICHRHRARGVRARRNPRARPRRTRSGGERDRYSELFFPVSALLLSVSLCSLSSRDPREADYTVRPTGGADNLLLLSRASYSAPGSYAHLDGHH